MQAQLGLVRLLEDGLGDEDVEVGRELERRAEALDEGHGGREWPGHSEPPRRPPLEGEERPDEEAQHLGQEPGIPGQTEAHRHGQRQRPLAVRSPGKHALHEVDGGVVCPAGIAGGAHPARLAREGDQHLGVAACTRQPREAVGQHSAREVPGEVALHEAREARPARPPRRGSCRDGRGPPGAERWPRRRGDARPRRAAALRPGDESPAPRSPRSPAAAPPPQALVQPLRHETLTGSTLQGAVPLPGHRPSHRSRREDDAQPPAATRPSRPAFDRVRASAPAYAPARRVGSA